MHYYTIKYGMGSIVNGAFFGAWCKTNEELSDMEWNSRKDCEKCLDILRTENKLCYWIDEEET